MENKNEVNLPKVPEGMSLLDALKLACLATGTPVDEDDERRRKCKELLWWHDVARIIEDEGDGTEIAITNKAGGQKFIYYNETARYDDIDTIAKDVFDSIEMGHTVTINGKDIFDIYKPYILCDEIWETLDEAGHGCEIVIRYKDNQTETLYYDQFASQDRNVRFMSHISEAMDEEAEITVNGTDIFDLYLKGE